MARFIAPKQCTVCKRQFRPKGTKEVDYPGTLLHSKQGMCHRCFSNDGVLVEAVRKLRTDPEPTACIECDEPMRPSKSLKRDHPGTVRHKSKGRCAKCYEESRMAKKEPADKSQPAPETTAAHNEFLAARNRRLQADLRRQKVRMVTK